jgi:hypothetical protein
MDRERGTGAESQLSRGAGGGGLFELLALAAPDDQGTSDSQ